MTQVSRPFAFVYATGTVCQMQPAQYKKASDIARRFGMCGTVVVSPVFGLKGAVGIDTGSMFIAVLEDGSSHS